MRPQAFLLPEPVLAEAAFQLLVSSSLDRYARAARRLASDTATLEALDQLTPAEVAQRAEQHWRFLVSRKTREPQEAELALLLAFLASTAESEADRILDRV